MLLTEVVRSSRQIAGLEQINLVVAATQPAARRLYQSIGFQQYGIERRSLKLDTEYIDDELMVLFL
jgi:RimJ/RimL family protein N-acetyltransferase